MKTQKISESLAKSHSLTLAKKPSWRTSIAGLAIAAIPLGLLVSGCSQQTAAPSTEPSFQVVAAQPSPEKVDLRGVEFQPDGKLQASSKPVLDAAAQLLKTQPDAKVFINAYCDPTGGAQLNKRLSDERATAVKAYLVKEGVAKDRLIARGRGATNFIASNTTSDGRKQNRRIELVLVRS